MREEGKGKKGRKAQRQTGKAKEDTNSTTRSVTCEGAERQKESKQSVKEKKGKGEGKGSPGTNGERKQEVQGHTNMTRRRRNFSTEEEHEKRRIEKKAAKATEKTEEPASSE